MAEPQLAGGGGADGRPGEGVVGTEGAGLQDPDGAGPPTGDPQTDGGGEAREGQAHQGPPGVSLV